MFAESEIDAKKMIVAQLISAVRVSRGYNIEIDFKISEKQLGLEQEYPLVAENIPKKKKQRNTQER